MRFKDFVKENDVKILKLYALPFRSSGLWVEDSKGKNLCECPSADIAKSLVNFLNRA